MGSGPDQPMADEPKSVGGVLVASLPAAIAAGLFAIGALLVNMQIQSARIEATLQQMAESVDELKTDAKAQLADLDRRVRQLEIRK
jgi:stage V sporulation protein SpoVS